MPNQLFDRHSLIKKMIRSNPARSHRFVKAVLSLFYALHRRQEMEVYYDVGAKATLWAFGGGTAVRCALGFVNWPNFPNKYETVKGILKKFKSVSDNAIQFDMLRREYSTGSFSMLGEIDFEALSRLSKHAVLMSENRRFAYLSGGLVRFMGVFYEWLARHAADEKVRCVMYEQSGYAMMAQLSVMLRSGNAHVEVFVKAFDVVVLSEVIRDEA